MIIIIIIITYLQFVSVVNEDFHEDDDHTDTDAQGKCEHCKRFLKLRVDSVRERGKASDASID